MLRGLAVLVTSALLAGSCGSAEPAAPNSTTGATTTSSAATSSTTAPPTTSTRATTTMPEPELPAAPGREEVPWEEVGVGWYLVLYDSSPADPWVDGELRVGPVGLFLVNHDAERYLLATWPGDDRPQAIVDAAGTSVLVSGRPSMDDDFQVEWIDLITGARRLAGTAGFPTRDLSEALFPRLVPPSGEAVTVFLYDGTTEWLERRSWESEILGALFAQAQVESPSSLRWLDRADGAAVVVLHREGGTEVTPAGEALRDLWVPADTDCYPKRWWDADTYLAACYGRAPGAAPLDDYGNLHHHYGRLWLLETDGSAGTPLTAFPAEPPFVGDYGYRDAWPAGDEVLLQWSGDCGAAAVSVLRPDGTGEPLQVEAPGGMAGVGMLDVVDGVVAIYGWEDCGAWSGALFTVDLTGHLVRDLFPVPEGARGVFGVRGLATVYP